MNNAINAVAWAFWLEAATQYVMRARGWTRVDIQDRQDDEAIIDIAAMMLSRNLVGLEPEPEQPEQTHGA